MGTPENNNDIKRDQLAKIMDGLKGLRAQVHADLTVKGPSTTQALADFMGYSVLTIRPRVTELIEIGLAERVGRQEGTGSGIYAAISQEEAQRRFHAKAAQEAAAYAATRAEQTTFL